MKSFIRCAAMACAFIAAGTAFAQSEPVHPVEVADDHPIWNDPLMDLTLVQLSAEFMVHELVLNEEQGEILHNIEAEINEQLLRVDDLPADQIAASEYALLKERTERVAEVLTPVQLDHLYLVKRNMLRDRAAKLAIQRETEAKFGLEPK